MYFLFRLKISSSLSIKTSSESFTIFSSGLLSVNKAVVVNADDVVSVAEVAVVDAVLALVVDCKKDKNL